jgi:hypothetical protein
LTNELDGGDQKRIHRNLTHWKKRPDEQDKEKYKEVIGGVSREIEKKGK